MRLVTEVRYNDFKMWLDYEVLEFGLWIFIFHVPKESSSNKRNIYVYIIVLAKTLPMLQVWLNDVITN